MPRQCTDLPIARPRIAFINSVGNLGGFVGPYAVGWIKDATGSFEGGLYALAGLAVVAAVTTIVFVRGHGPQQRTDGIADEPKAVTG